MKNFKRILDANINRLVEGIRVLEDFFRFNKDEEKKANYLKNLRHKIRNLTSTIDFIDFRDIKSDVGKKSFSKSERKRETMLDILIANLKRIQESSRVLEENFKLINSEIAYFFKKVRFDFYQLEKEIFSTKIRFLNYLKNASPVLYGIIDKRFSKFSYEDICLTFLNNNIKIIQLREKILSDKDFLKIAIKLKKLCTDFDAFFIVNDRIDIALASNADGIHLGQDDLPIKIAKNLYDIDKIFGLSTHNLDQVKDAIQFSPDYIGFGPLFPTKSKENPDPVVGVKLLKKVKSEYPFLPVVAIGGINEKNIEKVVSANPEMICIVSAIISSSNIEQKIKFFLKKLESVNKKV